MDQEAEYSLKIRETENKGSHFSVIFKVTNETIGEYWDLNEEFEYSATISDNIKSYFNEYTFDGKEVSMSNDQEHYLDVAIEHFLTTKYSNERPGNNFYVGRN